MTSQIAHKLLGILQCLRWVSVKFHANLLFHNLRQRHLSICRLPDDGTDRIQREQSGIPGRHNHHFTIERTSSHGGCPGNINGSHPINSQTRASGKKVKRYTGTCCTNSQAASKTRPTRSGSQAKNSTFSSSIRTASFGRTGSIVFSVPFRKRYKAASGALTFSPARPSSPANGVP